MPEPSPEDGAAAAARDGYCETRRQHSTDYPRKADQIAACCHVDHLGVCVHTEPRHLVFQVIQTHPLCCSPGCLPLSPLQVLEYC